MRTVSSGWCGGRVGGDGVKIPEGERGGLLDTASWKGEGKGPLSVCGKIIVEIV
jgi:hypothetical protein